MSSALPAPCLEALPGFGHMGHGAETMVRDSEVVTRTAQCSQGAGTGQAGGTHQGGVGLDGDQLCPSGAAVLSALLPALFGRREVVALPCIPEPANGAKLALSCTPETQQLGWGNWQGLPKGQERDSGQSGHQTTQFVRMSAPQRPLCTCPHLGAQLQPSSPRALGRRGLLQKRADIGQVWGGAGLGR